MRIHWTHSRTFLVEIFRWIFLVEMPYLISWNPCKERGRMFHFSQDELKRWKISTGRYDAPPSSMNHLLGTRTGLTAWPSSAVGRKSDLICIHQRPEYSQYFRDMKQVITGIVVRNFRFPSSSITTATGTQEEGSWYSGWWEHWLIRFLCSAAGEAD